MCKGGGFPCYAYRLANSRLELLYLANRNVAVQDISSEEYAFALCNPFYPRFWPERLDKLNPVYGQDTRAKQKGIFVCDMSDLFGLGIPEEWPQNLAKFSPFPDNCWVGVTATDTEKLMRACSDLEHPVQAKVKYLSIEPFLDWSYNFTQPYLINSLRRAGINWLIIGTCTGSNTELTKLNEMLTNKLTLLPYGNKWTLQPPIEWVQEIVEAADKAGIPVFLKENLSDLIPVNSNLRYGPAGELRLRQELPQ